MFSLSFASSYPHSSTEVNSLYFLVILYNILSFISVYSQDSEIHKDELWCGSLFVLLGNKPLLSGHL
jgi:hypothetical protein